MPQATAVCIFVRPFVLFLHHVHHKQCRMRESGGDSCLRTKNSRHKKKIRKRKSKTTATHKPNQTKPKLNEINIHHYISHQIFTLSRRCFASTRLVRSLSQSLSPTFEIYYSDKVNSISSPDTVIAFQTDLRTVQAILFEN